MIRPRLSSSRKRAPSRACSPKPALQERNLLTNGQAAALKALFGVLADGSRLRLLHLLVREGEVRVTDLARQLDMKPQAVSNQLQRLAARGIVDSHRNGTEIRYRIIDPCVTELLDRGLCLLEDAGQ